MVLRSPRAIAPISTEARGGHVSIESEAQRDLELDPEQAKSVTGGKRAKKTAHPKPKPAANSGPIMIVAPAATPAPVDPNAVVDPMDDPDAC
jgi:hypothetical protein